MIINECEKKEMKGKFSLEWPWVILDNDDSNQVELRERKQWLKFENILGRSSPEKLHDEIDTYSH